MARLTAGTRRSHRSRARRFVKSASFPRWITVSFVLIIGIMLWLGVLSDPSGELRMPGKGSILYVGAVIGLAAYLAYADSSRDSAGKNRRLRTGNIGRRSATAK